MINPTTEEAQELRETGMKPVSGILPAAAAGETDTVLHGTAGKLAPQGVAPDRAEPSYSIIERARQKATELLSFLQSKTIEAVSYAREAVRRAGASTLVGVEGAWQHAREKTASYAELTSNAAKSAGANIAVSTGSALEGLGTRLKEVGAHSTPPEHKVEPVAVVQRGE